MSNIEIHEFMHSNNLWSSISQLSETYDPKRFSNKSTSVSQAVANAASEDIPKNSHHGWH